jgi:hypothetical protein
MTQQSSLTALIHSESGVGKSQLLDTIPGPRLILDSEGGSEYTPSWPKQVWDPTYAPPGMQGCMPGQEQCAETVRVIVQDWNTWQRAMQWVISGNHPFLSMGVDSITEIQKRCRDNIRGPEQMQLQHWGELLILMETAVRNLRDVAKSPYNRLQNVVILALTDQVKERGRPLIQGALQMALPGFVDVIGYMLTQPYPEGAGLYRLMTIQPYGQFVAKDRTDILTQSFGPTIHIRDIHDPSRAGYNLADLVAVLESRYAAPAAAPNYTASGGTYA